MEDEKDRKKKFSFLKFLGVNQEEKNNSSINSQPIEQQSTEQPAVDEKNKFYVGNVQDAIKKRKTLLEEINK